MTNEISPTNHAILLVGVTLSHPHKNDDEHAIIGCYFARSNNGMITLTTTKVIKQHLIRKAFFPNILMIQQPFHWFYLLCEKTIG